ncbi:MAG: hypothetical protein IKF71_00995 [Bacilli bacterium]|nr:hypothetical protein [Bacilli bacterium]
MQENVELVELEKSLTKLKQLTDGIDHNLNHVNALIKDNINSGMGIWDSELAGMYRIRWESLMEEFPTVVNTFRQQATNLEIFIDNMKKVEER